MEKNTVSSYESTLSVLSSLNAVEGFDPHMLTACFKNEAGEEHMYLQAEPAMLWFRLKYPHGRLEQSVVRVTDTSATIEGRVFNDDGVMLANAFATRYYSNTDQYGRDYVQNAGTSAIRKALGIAGFGTPRDAEIIEGVTVIYEATSAPEQPVDIGRALPKRPVPPVPKPVVAAPAPDNVPTTVAGPAPAAQAPAEEPKKKNTPKRTAAPIDEDIIPTQSQVKPVAQAKPVATPPVSRPAPAAPTSPKPALSAAPSNLDEALAFTVPTGRFAGKTMKELLDEGEKDGIRFFLKPSYTGKPIQAAARMVAGQYSL